jgi:hypothetical protein
VLPQLAARAARQAGVFTAAQARSCGYSSGEIERLRRGGDWMALRRGVYAERSTVAAASDRRGRHRLDAAAALLVISHDDVVVSHLSAAVLWGLDTLGRPDLSVIRLTAPAPGWSRRYPGLGVWAPPRVRHAVRVLAFADGRAQSVAESLARVVFAELRRPDPLPQAKLVHGGDLVGYADYLLRNRPLSRRSTGN